MGKSEHKKKTGSRRWFNKFVRKPDVKPVKPVKKIERKPVKPDAKPDAKPVKIERAEQENLPANSLLESSIKERCDRVAKHCEHWYPKLGISLYNLLLPIDEDDVGFQKQYDDWSMVVNTILSTKKIMNKKDLSEDVDNLDTILAALEALFTDQSHLLPLRNIRNDIPKPIEYPPTLWQKYEYDEDDEDECNFTTQYEREQKLCNDLMICGPMKIYDQPLVHEPFQCLICERWLPFDYHSQICSSRCHAHFRSL